MRSVYLFSTLAVMVSGALSAELTGVELTFYSGPDADGDTHTLGSEAYVPNLAADGSNYLQGDSPMETVHINQWKHLVHKDEPYCIRTWKGGSRGTQLYSYPWNTADDDTRSDHPIYDQPDTALVTKGACSDDRHQLPPDKAWPKKS